MNNKKTMEFHDIVKLWQQADLAALAAEEAIVTIAQLAEPPTHDLLAKAAELRSEADRLFEELVARPTRSNIQSMGTGNDPGHLQPDSA